MQLCENIIFPTELSLHPVAPRGIHTGRLLSGVLAMLCARLSLRDLGQKKITIIVIVMTGLHKKPQGCGASVASAAGPFTTKKERPTRIYLV
jgi:hypothetical protein